MLTRALVLLLLSAGLQAQQADTVRITLDEALHRAETRSFEPQRIDALRGQAESAALRTLAPPPPELSVEYGFIPRGAAIGDYGERSIAIDQVFPSPFSLYYRYREAAAKREETGTELHDALRAFRNHVTRGYVHLAATTRRVAISEEIAEGAAFEARAAELRFSTGDAAKTDVLAARAMRTEAELARDRMRAELRKAHIAFATLLAGEGAEEDLVFLPVDTLALPGTLPGEEDIRRTIMDRSPRIRAARSALDAARASSSLALANLLPAISVGVMDQREPGRQAMYGVRVGVAVPLWFVFDQRHAIRQADARVAEAEVLFAQARAGVRAWIRTALTEYRLKREEAHRYQAEVLPEARQLLALTKKGWTAGETGFLEVIQAQRYYATASDEALSALVACLDIWTELQSLLKLEEK